MVLVLVLTLLVALTVLGVSSLSNSTLETRMASNFQDKNAAFQSAEAALREAERLIQTNNYTGSQFDNQCTNGLCECDEKTSCDYSGDTSQTFWELDAVWNTSSKHMSYSTFNISELAAPAKYIIEHMGNVCKTDATCNATSAEPRLFRITAIGYGTSATSKVMLQSTYIKK